MQILAITAFHDQCSSHYSARVNKPVNKCQNCHRHWLLGCLSRFIGLICHKWPLGRDNNPRVEAAVGGWGGGGGYRGCF